MTKTITSTPLTHREMVEFSNMSAQLLTEIFSNCAYPCNNGVITHFEIEIEV